jgi:hypothetical protein
MANSVTRLCHNCAVKPAHAAQVAIFDSSRLLIPCKLQKLRGGPDNPAYRLIRQFLVLNCFVINSYQFTFSLAPPDCNQNASPSPNLRHLP